MKGTESATARMRRRSPISMQLERVARVVSRPQRMTQAMMKMMTPALLGALMVPSIAVESLLRTPPTIQRMRAMNVKVVRRWKIRGGRM